TDPFLLLLNSTGSQIASDSDSGAGNNARIIFAPSVTGTYYLEASDFYHLGTYKLSATDLGPPPLTFAQPTFELSTFGLNAGGWSSDNTYPRQLGDVNHDGLADIIGFGNAGVWVARATGGGHFARPTFELAAFGPN